MEYNDLRFLGGNEIWSISSNTVSDEFIPITADRHQLVYTCSCGEKTATLNHTGNTLRMDIRPGGAFVFRCHSCGLQTTLSLKAIEEDRPQWDED